MLALLAAGLVSVHDVQAQAAAPSASSSTGSVGDPGPWQFAQEGGGAGTPTFTVGADDPVCNQLRAYMNRHGAAGAHRCEASARAMPGVESPPWNDLDPTAHRLLISRLLRYASEGEVRYFNRASAPARRPDADRYFLEQADKFIAAGGQLQLWRTAPYEPPPPVLARMQAGEAVARNLVQLRPAPPSHPSNAPCWAPTTSARIFFVSDDLSDLDPAVTPGFYPDRAIALYGGDRVLIDEGRETIDFYREQNHHFVYACRLVTGGQINREPNR